MNPNIPQLLAGTANACSAAGCDSAPPVGVGLVLRTSAQGSPVASIAPGTKGYLTVALDVDFRGTDLMLFAYATVPPVANPTWNALSAVQVTSWTSNGIRDQNLLAETGLPGSAFDITSLRRLGFDTAPTAARQQIVIEITNPTAAPHTCVGLIAGVCGDCNTSNR